MYGVVEKNLPSALFNKLFGTEGKGCATYKKE